MVKRNVCHPPPGRRKLPIMPRRTAIAQTIGQNLNTLIS
jgi:hypothetical protein